MVISAQRDDVGILSSLSAQRALMNNELSHHARMQSSFCRSMVCVREAWRWGGLGRGWEQEKLEATLREMLENAARREAAVPSVQPLAPRSVAKTGCTLCQPFLDLAILVKLANLLHRK